MTLDSVALDSLTIVMYHYVRELPLTRYPAIKGLRTSQFRHQLNYLRRFYTFVTRAQCLEALHGGRPLPANAVVLTFDDAYADHYTDVFPLLHEYGIEGWFFPPVRAVRFGEVLSVNKIHFVLASTAQPATLVPEVRRMVDDLRADFSLRPSEEYYQELAVANRYDDADVIFLKRLLQHALPESARDQIVDRLFAHYVTDNEQAFAHELYMTEDQLRCMSRAGMYVGSHGYGHYWLNTLTPEQQEREVGLSLEFLAELGAPTKDWVMCYPYGGYNESLLAILRRHDCGLGLTTHVGIASLNRAGALTLARLDTNDLPREADVTQPAEWTQRVKVAA